VHSFRCFSFHSDDTQQSARLEKCPLLPTALRRQVKGKFWDKDTEKFGCSRWYTDFHTIIYDSTVEGCHKYTET
jgi:hypothetical protein